MARSARPGPDHHAEPRLDRQEGLVELHLSPGLALEKVVSFEQSLVVVKPRICADVRDVNRAGEVSHFGQSAARFAARAGDCWQLAEVDEFKGGVVRVGGSRCSRHRVAVFPCSGKMRFVCRPLPTRSGIALDRIVVMPERNFIRFADPARKFEGL